MANQIVVTDSGTVQVAIEQLGDVQVQISRTALLGVSGFSGFSGMAGAFAGSGFSGFSGVSGASGMPGSFAASGFSGFSGVSGTSGFSGLGLSGYSGISGISGESGISGYSGVSGESGISGYSGVSGESGISGYSGESGYSGVSGESGISGYSGVSGESGYSGISGESGISGYSGVSGFSGESGYSGVSGYSGYSGISGQSGAVGAGGTIGHWGAFWDTNDQYANSNTSSYFISFNSSDPDNTGVSIVSNNQVTFSNAGTYSVTYSVQFNNANNNVKQAEIWLLKNGNDVSDTNSNFDIPGAHGGGNGHLIGTVNYVLELAANDYLQLAWWAETSDITLEYIGPSVSPTRPATPSVILTATQVMYTQSGYSGYSGTSGISGYSGQQGVSGFSGAGTPPGGSNTNVQFNDNGSFGGSNAFTFNNTTNTVTSANLVVSDVANTSGTNTKLNPNTRFYNQTEIYHPNASTNFPAQTLTRYRGNSASPTTVVVSDRLSQRIIQAYNGNASPLAASEIVTVSNVNTNSNAAVTGGQWSITTGNPSGSNLASGSDLSGLNNLTFTNSGGLNITPGTPANTSLGQQQSPILITNFGQSTTNLSGAGGIAQQKARGNRASLQSVQPNDVVGENFFYGYNGNAYYTAAIAGFRAIVDNTYTAGNTIIPQNIQIAAVDSTGTRRFWNFNGNTLAEFPGDITTTANISTGNLSVTSISNLGGNANVKITGGNVSEVLTTDGTGNLSWANITGYSGFSGTSGFSGIGDSGYSGFSGTQGFSGISGFSGAPGSGGAGEFQVFLLSGM